MRRLLPLVALLGLAVACEPPPDVEPLACKNAEPGTVELGLGNLNTGFMPMADGERVPIQLGPQGMHMVVVSVQVTDLELPAAGGLGTEIRIALRFRGQVVGGTVNALQPSIASDEVSEFLGLRPVITEAEVDELAEQTVDVEVTVSDGCGRELYDEREWVLYQ